VCNALPTETCFCILSHLNLTYGGHHRTDKNVLKNRAVVFLVLPNLSAQRQQGRKLCQLPGLAKRQAVLAPRHPQDDAIRGQANASDRDTWICRDTEGLVTTPWS
jgi:hypothetical protein